MGRLSIGMSRTGGKSRSILKLLEYTPRHEFFMSLFCGACWFELNKPRCRYEIFNDIDSELINYLLMTRKYPDCFDDIKEGVFGLVSQEVCNRIVNGELKPVNNLERAYFFYYTNKMAFGGHSDRFTYMGMNPPSSKKASYKGVGMKHYRGVSMVGLKEEIKKAKANYIGINPNTTRPWTRNDNGLLTPLNPAMIERLRYVNITCYPFQRVYKLFHRAFGIKRGLTKEVFIYEDPPYPGTEKYYKTGFGMEDHQDLIDINLESPFNIMQSIGGDCDFYIDSYKDAGWVINPVKVKYSTDASSQKESQEYICMNYDIKKEALMKYDSFQKTIM